jgi:hypothetical protein
MLILLKTKQIQFYYLFTFDRNYSLSLPRQKSSHISTKIVLNLCKET